MQASMQAEIDQLEADSCPPPPPPPCQSALDLKGCNGKCSDEFDACMDGKDECTAKGKTRKQCKKACKNKRATCKNACDAATKCPACEDNDISGFGTPWCETNAVSSTFCASAHGAKKCKKTCDLCDSPRPPSPSPPPPALPPPSSPPLCGGQGPCVCPYDGHTGGAFPSVVPLTSKTAALALSLANAAALVRLNAVCFHHHRRRHRDT